MGKELAKVKREKEKMRLENEQLSFEVEKLETESQISIAPKQEYALGEIEVIKKAKVILDRAETQCGLIFEYNSPSNARTKWLVNNEGYCNKIRELVRRNFGAKITSEINMIGKQQFLKFMIQVENDDSKINKMAYVFHYIARIVAGLPEGKYFSVEDIINHFDEVAKNGRKNNVHDPKRDELKKEEVVPRETTMSADILDWINKFSKPQLKRKFDKFF